VNTETAYTVDLSDLILIAEAACEFDGIKDQLFGEAKARAQEFVTRLHALAERAAGKDAGRIYADGDEDRAV